jgi:hypothetical protein
VKSFNINDRMIRVSYILDYKEINASGEVIAG